MTCLAIEIKQPAAYEHNFE